MESLVQDSLAHKEIDENTYYLPDWPFRFYNYVKALPGGKIGYHEFDKLSKDETFMEFIKTKKNLGAYLSQMATKHKVFIHTCCDETGRPFENGKYYYIAKTEIKVVRKPNYFNRGKTIKPDQKNKKSNNGKSEQKLVARSNGRPDMEKSQSVKNSPDRSVTTTTIYKFFGLWSHGNGNYS